MIAIFLFILVWRFSQYSKVANAKSERLVPSDWKSLSVFIKEQLEETVYSDFFIMGISEDRYEELRSLRSELKTALQSCASGNVRHKKLVKQFIYKKLVQTFLWQEADCNVLLPFDQSREMSGQDLFDIILYVFQKQKGSLALQMMLEKFGHPKTKIELDDLRLLFRQIRPRLSLEDKLAIITQRLYQQMFGLGVVDEIRDQLIDGLSAGVSGWPSSWMMEPTKINDQLPQYDYDSVWIFYRGISVRLAFLSFCSLEELKRVCQNIYKFNYPGQLSERNGYIVNQLADGSRVVVVRPPFAETWAFFLRKFDVPKAKLEQWTQGVGAQFLQSLLFYLIKGARVTAITGAQGAGKTTLLMALVQEIDTAYNIRVQEMAFELRLRAIDQNRNILSFCETESISGQAGLDLQKKTDGTVNIIGEVASDAVAAWMIQAAQVASLFTLFTHHAKSFSDLISSLRNSLLKTGMFHDERMAEQQVVQVLHFNIHVKRARNGVRYIERITECVATAPHSVALYEEREILRYIDGGYVPSQSISYAQTREMSTHMNHLEQQQFQDFIHHYWPEEVPHADL
jgi:pilus assembly protein CpaF